MDLKDEIGIENDKITPKEYSKIDINIFLVEKITKFEKLAKIFLAIGLPIFIISGILCAFTFIGYITGSIGILLLLFSGFFFKAKKEIGTNYTKCPKCGNNDITAVIHATEIENFKDFRQVRKYHCNNCDNFWNNENFNPHL